MRTLLAGDETVGDLLAEFFQCAPVREMDPEEDEFFGTSTYLVQEGDLVLELSVDSFTTRATVQLSQNDRCLFQSSLVVEKFHLKPGIQRSLQLETASGTLLIFYLPEIELRVTSL